MDLSTDICIRLLKAARKAEEVSEDADERNEWQDLIDELESAIVDTGVI